jgi:hypothetical protein
MLMAAASFSLAVLEQFQSDTIALVSIMQWLFGLSIIALGLLLVLKRPTNRIGFVSALAGLGISLAGFT